MVSSSSFSAHLVSSPGLARLPGTPCYEADMGLPPLTCSGGDQRELDDEGGLATVISPAITVT